MKILVLNGPNLDILGKREPEIYGSVTLSKINKKLLTLATKLGYELNFFQSNHEGKLIDKINSTLEKSINFIIFNPAAYTHTSIALRDAILAANVPFIEVHLSNIFQRESFRHNSYFSDIAQGVICGFGVNGYEMALIAIHNQNLDNKLILTEKNDGN